jgi:hypothetical protein
MKERIVRLGLVGAIALTIPAAAAAHGPGDAAKGLDKAAEHSQGNAPTTVGQPTNDEDTGKPETAGDRPHNHGWYVSQVARDESQTAKNSNGQWTHGAAVSDVAKGDQGKP